MPHAVWSTGDLSATDLAFEPRKLIPGIEPGGSRAGDRMKPVLLIENLWGRVSRYNPSTGTGQKHAALGLRLSNEQDLDPGLVLPVLDVGPHAVDEGDATGRYNEAAPFQHHGQHYNGMLFAPEWVGVVADLFNVDTLNGQIHLDYRAVEVPFMDWFFMNEFFDGLPAGRSVEF